MNAGDRIAGRYEILSVVGEGRMGVVYMCQDHNLGRIVAVKTLRLQRMSEQSSQLRFEREARAASRLSHPNIITIHDFGQTAIGVPYLVMDHVSGETLHDILKTQHYLPPARAVVLFSQICEGLYHAHQRGVIHRDLKPDNIMVVRNEDNTETVKIVDLGIARIVYGDETDSDPITKSGEVCGTPIYLSPEQCLYLDTDPRTDQYSLGVCLYEALTGLPPLRGATVYDTLYMHVHNDPLPLCVVNPDLNIPRRLEEAVFRCLAKEQKNRFDNMMLLKQELLSFRKQKTEGSGSVNVMAPDALYGKQLASPSSELPAQALAIQVSPAAQLSTAARLEKTVELPVPQERKQSGQTPQQFAGQTAELPLAQSKGPSAEALPGSRQTGEKPAQEGELRRRTTAEIPISKYSGQKATIIFSLLALLVGLGAGVAFVSLTNFKQDSKAEPKSTPSRSSSAPALPSNSTSALKKLQPMDNSAPKISSGKQRASQASKHIVTHKHVSAATATIRPVKKTRTTALRRQPSQGYGDLRIVRHADGTVDVYDTTQ